MIRYNVDGSLDTGFCACGTGRVLINSGIRSSESALGITAGNELLVAANTRVANKYSGLLLRCYADGTLDKAFGTNGFVKVPIFNSNVYFTSIYVLPAGDLLVSGYNNAVTNGFVMKFNADGAADSTFGKNGSSMVTIDSTHLSSALKMVVQKDGKIIIAGNGRGYDNHTGTNYDIGNLIRLLPNGIIDSTFGDNGRITNFVPQQHCTLADIGFTANGNLVATGYYYKGNSFDSSNLFIARYVITNATGVANNNISAGGLSLYPNPTTGAITLSAANTTGIAVISVCNMLGKTVYSIQHNFTFSVSATISLSQQPAGMYFVKVAGSNGAMQVAKLLKQ